MSGELDGRVAIVTGAADGIGRGIARCFAGAGAKLLVADIDEGANVMAAEELRDELGADVRAMRVDVSRKQDVLDMVAAAGDSWGQVDVLVNNAWGGGRLCRVEQKPDDLFDAGFHVGFYGPLWAMQAAFPLMRRQSWGRIINLCSLNGVNAHIGTLEYNCAKEALRTLTRTAAREWAPHGIVVNAICPAAKTAAFHRVAAANPSMEALADAANPMGRIGDPEEDIAPVAVFLAGDDVSYMTGNTLFVDGGSHINGSPWSPELPD